MITQVNNLIYNTLCKGSDVAIPTVGSLVLRRSAATKSKAGFVPPQRTVSFTGELRGLSLHNLIATEAGVDAARADEIFAQWLDSVKQGEKVVIEGVGTIENRTFTPSEQLLSALNPMTTAAPTPKAKGDNGLLIAIIVVLLLAVAGLLLYIFLGKSEPEVVTPVPAPVVEAVEPAPEPEPTPEPVVDGVERMAEGGNYIVWGVFAELDNAKSYERMLERYYPELDCKIYHHRNDTMYLLAVDSCPTRTACLERMWSLQERDGLFDDMWIFTNK